jgi:hypothetical protein
MIVSKFEGLCDLLRVLFARTSTALVVPVLLLMWRLVLSSQADPDLFARVSMGRLVEKLRSVPLHDPFAFTAKLPMWIDHEWFSGVVFYQIASQWGDAGLIVLKLLISGWTAVLLVRASILYSPRASGRVLWAAICILEASYLWGSTIRCQVFTYFTLALIYYGLAQYRALRVRRYLALIPLASLALVNMHGGYALSLIVLSLMTLCAIIEGKPWRLLFVVTSLSALAPLATPYGFRDFVGYLIRALSMERPTITEWAPLSSDVGGCARVALIVVPLLVGILMAARRSKLDLTALVLLGFSFYCGVSHIRFIGFAMLTAVVFGASYVGDAIELLRRTFGVRTSTIERVSAFACALVVVTMGAQCFIALVQPRTWRLDTSGYPLAAVEWLRESGAAGRLLVDFNNGSLAQWRLYPRFLVSMDGRYEEVYTNETVELVSQAFLPHTSEGAAALRQISPTHILFGVSNEASAAQAALATEWREIYRDERAAIFTNVESPKAITGAPARFDLWSPMF